MMALGLAPEEPLLQSGDELVFAGDFTLGGGEFGLKSINSFEESFFQRFQVVGHRRDTLTSAYI